MSLRARATTEVLVRLANRPGQTITVDGLRSLLGPPTTKDDAVKGVTVSPTRLGGMAAERYELTRGTAGELLAFHGGGYIAGTARHFRSLFAALARTLGLAGTSVDYRLAPEHAFPAPIEDGIAAYRELLERGMPSESIVLAGESAGGGVALSTALAARDAGLPMPRALILYWPFADCSLSGPSLVSNAGRDFLTRALVELSAASFLAGHDARDPLASPVFADVEGLPPVHLQVGDRDLLLSDSERLAQRFEAAGVPVQLHVARNAVHGFASAGDALPEGRRSLAVVQRWWQDLASAG